MAEMKLADTGYPGRNEEETMNRFWKWVRNKAPDGDDLDRREEERTLFLNGTIASESWFDDEVTPALFKSELNSGEGDITVWINSPGGDCFAAAQIYNMLRDYAGRVTVKIDGIAASAASVIAMAGDTVLVSPVSMLMIHNPATIAMGDHNDMQKAIEMLEAVRNSIINAYAVKTGMSHNKLAELMENETWMDAREAVKLHFADGVISRREMLKEEPDEDDPDEEESGGKKSRRGDEPDEGGRKKPGQGDDPDEDDPDKESGKESGPGVKKAGKGDDPDEEEEAEEESSEEESEKKKKKRSGKKPEEESEDRMYGGRRSPGMLFSRRLTEQAVVSKVVDHCRENVRNRSGDEFRMQIPGAGFEIRNGVSEYGVRGTSANRKHVSDMEQETGHRVEDCMKRLDLIKSFM